MISVFSKNSIISSLSFTDFLESSSKFSSFRCLPLKKVSRSIRAFLSLSKQSPDIDFVVMECDPHLGERPSWYFSETYFRVLLGWLLAISPGSTLKLRCSVFLWIWFEPSGLHHDFAAWMSFCVFSRVITEMCQLIFPEGFAMFRNWFCENAFSVYVVHCFFQNIPCCNGVFKNWIVRKRHNEVFLLGCPASSSNQRRQVWT